MVVAKLYMYVCVIWLIVVTAPIALFSYTTSMFFSILVGKASVCNVLIQTTRRDI